MGKFGVNSFLVSDGKQIESINMGESSIAKSGNVSFQVKGLLVKSFEKKSSRSRFYFEIFIYIPFSLIHRTQYNVVVIQSSQDLTLCTG